MAKKELRKIKGRENKLLSDLLFNAFCALSMICDYMQSNTKYGEAYEKAFKQHKKLSKALDVYEDLLVDCMANKK